MRKPLSKDVSKEVSMGIIDYRLCGGDKCGFKSGDDLRGPKRDHREPCSWDLGSWKGMPLTKEGETFWV